MNGKVIFIVACLMLAWGATAQAEGTLRVTVSDHDGWGDARCNLYAWDETDRDWKRVADRATRDGVAEIQADAGNYQLRVTYKEGDPDQERTIESVQIRDGQITEESLYFERGELQITVSDHDGAGRASCRLMVWNDADRKWDSVRSRDASNGHASFEAAPGVYQLRVTYTEGDMDQEQIFDGLQITDNAVIQREAYFERGKVELTVTDHDGWGSASCKLMVWNDETREWDHVASRSTHDGRVAFEAPPGTYSIRVRYNEGEPEQERTIEPIRITDSCGLTRSAYFERGRLQLTVTDQDGWGRVKCILKWWNEAEGQWETVDDATSQDGRLGFDMAPGFYRMVIRYLESDPVQELVMDNITMADRMLASRFVNFGGDPPPVISSFGPIEVGDGDGYYEVGEKVLFRIGVDGDDVTRVEFTTNEALLAEADSQGRFEPILDLTTPGELRFVVRAWDEAGTLETYESVIPVSAQQDQRVVSEAAYVTEDLLPGASWAVCPECGFRYPGDMTVCPLDGAALVPVEQESHGAGPNATAPDEELPGHGLEPEQIVDFGLGWMNVFTQPQQGQDLPRRIESNAVH